MIPRFRRLIVCWAMASALACSRGPVEPGAEQIDPALRRLSVGETSVCAIHAGDTYCWGSATDRQFGEFVPGFVFVATPYRTAVAGLARFAGGSGPHRCGLTSGNSAICWGRNSNGQSGTGSTGTPIAPTAVAGERKWAEISIGRISTCGVSTSGDAYCWGSNFAGEIGVDSIAIGTNSPNPMRVSGDFALTSMAAGWRHACGIASTGAAYCWGENTKGQLGIGTADSAFHRAPIPVTGSERFVQLSVGGRYTCGITVDHRTLCWGDNSTGQLGDGTVSDRYAPTAVSSSVRFRTIVTSSGFSEGATVLPNDVGQGSAAHTCALTESGAPYCWGWNGNGQAGTGSTTPFEVRPAAVAGNLKLDAIGVGGAFSCGMRGNTIWCWGANAVGQLGNGGIGTALTPSPVGAPFNSE